jgi:ribosomal protein S12 methylthiotransferase accessory factor
MRTPVINIASASDPMVVEMIKKYQNAGIKLFVTDFTMGMGIPTVGVLAYDPVTFPDKSEIVWTAGTTPDPQKAFSRALTEVAQLAGDFNTGANYVASGLPKFKTLNEAQYVTQPASEINITDLPDISDDNIRVEVERCLSRLSLNNFEVIVVDTQHPELQIPAFYTIIPGAHFRERALGTSVGMFCAKIMVADQTPPEAIAGLKNFDAMLPGKYYINFYLGSCHLALKEPEVALDYFEKALKQNPTEQDLVSIYAYKGICLKDLGAYRQALAVLAEGEKLDNERTDIYNLIGFCHYQLKEHEKAIENFKRVLSLDPASAIDYANIASNYREMGEMEKAEQYYVMALELDPGIEFARQNLERLQQME